MMDERAGSEGNTFPTQKQLVSYFCDVWVLCDERCLQKQFLKGKAQQISRLLSTSQEPVFSWLTLLC